eukprot:1626920-Alexandrium_andersonii.AAC.1
MGARDTSSRRAAMADSARRQGWAPSAEAPRGPLGAAPKNGPRTVGKSASRERREAPPRGAPSRCAKASSPIVWR